MHLFPKGQEAGFAAHFRKPTCPQKQPFQKERIVFQPLFFRGHSFVFRGNITFSGEFFNYHLEELRLRILVKPPPGLYEVCPEDMFSLVPEMFDKLILCLTKTFLVVGRKKTSLLDWWSHKRFFLEMFSPNVWGNGIQFARLRIFFRWVVYLDSFQTKKNLCVQVTLLARSNHQFKNKPHDLSQNATVAPEGLGMPPSGTLTFRCHKSSMKMRESSCHRIQTSVRSGRVSTPMTCAI